MVDDLPLSDTERALVSLGARLQGLPTEKFLAAIKLLSPVAGRDVVAAVLDEARPRLRELRPVRPTTIKRLLCEPFEDLLVSGPGAAEDSVRIPRRLIGRLWQVLSESGGLAAFEPQLNVVGDDPKQVRALSLRLWRWATERLSRTEAGSSGTEHGFALMCDALNSAEVIADYREAVPMVPLPMLDEAVGQRVIRDIEQLRRDRRPVDIFLLVVAARLASPSQLRALLDKQGGRSAGLTVQLDGIAATVVGDRAARFSRDAEGWAPDELARHADDLIRAVLETAKAIGPAEREVFEKRTERLADQVGRALTRQVIEPGPKAVLGALPHAPSKAVMLEAETYARALYRASKTAATVGMAGRMERAVAEIHDGCASRIKQCLAQALDCVDAGARRDIEVTMYRSIRLIELTEGANAAKPFLDAARQRLRPG